MRRALARFHPSLVVAVALLGLALAAASSSAAPGHVSRVAANDRSFKLDLITRLKSAPETVVLGSSRGKRAEPSYLERLTGRSAFNAAVISGTAADAWVMTRYLADCLPLQGRRYIWFVDAGIATNGINPGLEADPRSRGYLGLAPAARPSCSPHPLASGNDYNPDGSFGPKSRHLRGHVKGFDAKVARLVASVRAHRRSLATRAAPSRYVWFERALAFMNAHGSRPVIVLNPIYPAVLAALRQAGFPARKASDAYLARLHKRFDFVVVDAEDIHHWGGSARDFVDPTHINDTNMRRLLGYVLAHSDGALR